MEKLLGMIECVKSSMLSFEPRISLELSSGRGRENRKREQMTRRKKDNEYITLE